MKRVLIVLVLFTMGCSAGALLPGASAPTETPAAETSVPPSPSPLPTETALPNPTPLPPTATPLPAAIGAQNAGGLAILSEIGSTSTRKIAFSPDGGMFATAGGNDNDYAVRLWSSLDGEPLASPAGFTGIVWDAAFSPDGKWIASAANDQNGRRLRVWNTSDGSPVVALEGPSTASSVAFSPDGSRLAVGGLGVYPQGTVYIYETSGWNLVQILDVPGQNVTAVLFTPDGSLLISAGTDGRIRAWSTSGWGLAGTFQAGKQANRLAVSPNGRLLASSFCLLTDTYGCTKGGINIWRLSDWTVLQQFGDLAETLAFSPDENLLFSGSGANDPALRIRRTDDWSLAAAFDGQTYSLAVSPDGRTLVSADWNQVVLRGLP